jgi:protein-L-isoaspartate(D-aspartate) O-methyltransferase
MNITTSSLNHILNSSFLAGLVLLSALGFFSFGLSQHETERFRQKDYAQARRQMVEKDLRARGIKDPRVLEAMTSVPRHLFVEERLRASAYRDRPLPIGQGQTISQPYIVALMTELLELKGNETVLEIGTGSGYQAAVLSHLAKEVYTVEIIPSLAERAKERLDRLGYANVSVKTGDGFFGWKEKAPFDAILLTASAESTPEPLWDQLRERGYLVMPMGEANKDQKLVRVKKMAGQQQAKEITGVIFVPMTGANRKELR